MAKLIIIGAGIAGLSTGCYAQMNGYETEIYESHSLPGGVCTSWRRGDYLFDHCLHWVLGSGPQNTLYPLFEELGVVPAVRFHFTNRFRVIRSGDMSVTVYTDIERLEAELLRVFPHEAKAIRRMTRLVRRYTQFRPPMESDFGSFTFGEMAGMLPFLPTLFRLMRTSVEQYLEMFRDPQLREILYQMFPVPSLPALMVILPLAYFHNKEGGYPLGGSLGFARAIERRYLELGGRINYGRPVKRVLVESDAVTGVETVDGERHLADAVVSACDGRQTLFGMLGGHYLTPRLQAMYADPSLWPPILSVSLGVKRDLTGEPEILNHKLAEPWHIAGQRVEWLGCFMYGHDPVFAPPGKGVIEVQIETDYDYWRDLYADRPRYRAAKQAVLELCMAELEKIYPGIADQVEVSDVATPVTWERYTGNWRGSYQGWIPTVELFGKNLPNELPGLRGFYMTGQWTFLGGGVPMCMAQARRLVQHMCRQAGKGFRVSG